MFTPLYSVGIKCIGDVMNALRGQTMRYSGKVSIDSQSYMFFYNNSRYPPFVLVIIWVKNSPFTTKLAISYQPQYTE